MNRFPKDLATVVWSQLAVRDIAAPSVDTLIGLFETMYFASLQTEERHPITCSMVYLDPEALDLGTPRRAARDRWGYARLSAPVPLTIQTLVKLAQASDPPASALAVSHDAQGQLVIWGLVEQTSHSSDVMTYYPHRAPDRPGVFQADIVDVGHLAVYVQWDKVAELKANTLRHKKDVFSQGPVRNALQPAIAAHVDGVRSTLAQQVYHSRPDWNASLAADWLAALSQILLRARAFRHGGAVLITPDRARRGLSVTYPIHYRRLHAALQAHALTLVRHTYAADRIAESYVDHKTGAIVAASVPLDLYLDESALEDSFVVGFAELDGALRFIAQLTRVDGLVLMSPDLTVHGFGVEITVPDEPAEWFLADSSRATKSRLRRGDYTHFGTRHRSMMRYCAQVAGSVGFVISQDDEVRVMTQVGGRLVMWDNIELQREFTTYKGRPKHSDGLQRRPLPDQENIRLVTSGYSDSG